MSWLDTLRQLFLPKLKQFINIDLSRTQNINIVYNDYSSKYDYDDESRHITFNLPKLDSCEKRDLAQVIDSALSENSVILESKSQAELLRFAANDTNSDTQKKLDFLRTKIPKEDLPIWRAALYLRSCFKEGEKVDTLKSDIIMKYGKRGANIANLCSAGYLESWLIPTYEVFKGNSENETLAVDKFQVLYRIIVEELSFSVFVSYWIKPEEIKELIQSKMRKNLKYGIKFLNIHGIGDANVKTIRKIVEKIEKTQQVKKSIIEENKIIEVRLEFDTKTENAT